MCIVFFLSENNKQGDINDLIPTCQMSEEFFQAEIMRR
jgi:hypothetical protein